jgi:uncharacterized protein YqkB
MELFVTDSALTFMKPKLTNNPVILLSYDDGVGPYSPHGLVALQIAFKLVLISEDMPKKDYNVTVHSNIGDLYVKDYSQRFLGDHLTIKLNENYQVLSLTDDGEVIEDNLQIVDYRS